MSAQPVAAVHPDPKGAAGAQGPGAQVARAQVAPAAGTHAAVAPAPGRGAAAFEPVLIGFTCNWCSYRAADLAGTARIKYPPNVRLIRLMCSGRLDPTFVLKAFESGADAVIMTGCWPADCHYRIQNVKALRRFQLLRRVLVGLGIEPARFQRVYASAAEGQQLAEEFSRIVEEVRALGPLGWGRTGRDPAGGVASLAADLDASVGPAMAGDGPDPAVGTVGPAATPERPEAAEIDPVGAEAAP